MMLNAISQKVFISIVSVLLSTALNAKEVPQNSNASKVVNCPPAPKCYELPECTKTVLHRPRDTRNCLRKFGGVFTINDPACEAKKAAANAKYSNELYVEEAKYRQCLENKRSAQLKCKIAYTDWKICISKLIDGYTPKR